MKTENAPVYVSAIPEFQRYGIGRTKAYEVLNEGRIPAFRVYGKTMVRPDDLAEFAKSFPSYKVKKGRPKKSIKAAPWDDPMPDDLFTSPGTAVDPSIFDRVAPRSFPLEPE